MALRILNFVCLLLALLLAPGCYTVTKPSGPTVAYEGNSELYHDRNGYFVAVKPSGWETREFPGESIRSKVQFQHPNRNGVQIEVIATPTPSSLYSLDDLVAENREKLDALKGSALGGTFIQKGKVFGREAVVQRVTVARGKTDFAAVAFIENQIVYQIAIYNNPGSEGESAFNTFTAFQRSFTILDHGKRFSDVERRAALVARHTSLAKMYRDRGETSEALKAVTNGLLFDPKNKELLDLRDMLMPREK